MSYDCPDCEHLEKLLNRAEDRADEAERALRSAELELSITPDIDAVQRLEGQRNLLYAALEGWEGIADRIPISESLWDSGEWKAVRAKGQAAIAYCDGGSDAVRLADRREP